jgi:hypothetical protein
MASASHSGVLVVQDERFAGNRSLPSAGRQMLMPVLLGLGVPGVAVSVFAPQLLSNPALVFGFYLMAIFVVAAVIFIKSIFNPGTIVEATFDQRAKSANFVRLGTFATTNTAVAFKDITRIYIETHYDDDGYKSYMPLVEIKNGETLQLPEGTTQGEIDAIRTMVGK